MGRSRHHGAVMWPVSGTLDTRRSSRAVASLLAGWLLVWFGGALSLAAHPVSVTRALVYVSRERVTVTLEVFLEDLYLFHQLSPDGADVLSPGVIQRGIELHREFVATRFLVQNADGAILKPDSLPAVAADIPEAGVPLAELMAHRLTFDFQFTLADPPAVLTFQHRFTDADRILPSEMQLQVTQENSGRTSSRSLPADLPEIIRFDWVNPPLPPDASQQERDLWLARQREELLGITSDSAVYSFLYVERDEVRLEILIPLLTLEQGVSLERRDRDFLSVSEQQAVRPLIEQYFLSGNPLDVDGQRWQPIVERLDFFGVDFRDFARPTEARDVAMSSARAGIILSYPLESPPRNLKLTWDRFHQSLWAVSLVVFTPDGASRRMLSRVGGRNVFEWSTSAMAADPPLQPVMASLPPVRSARVPVLTACLGGLSLWVWRYGSRSALNGHPSTDHPGRHRIAALALCAAAAIMWPVSAASIDIPFGRPLRIAGAEADRAFSQLLHNVYGAFRRRGEQQVYHSLAVSTDGELLQELYIQIQQGLRMQEQGGAVARVRRLEILDAALQSEGATVSAAASTPPGFMYRCRWNVSGTVEHWGHIHERTNQLEAIFHVVALPADSGETATVERHWKFTQMNIVDSQRLQFETRLRNVEGPP